MHEMKRKVTEAERAVIKMNVEKGKRQRNTKEEMEENN